MKESVMINSEPTDEGCARPETTTDLETLLAPLSVERLATEHWDRSAVYIPGPPEKLRGFQFGVADYFRLCERNPRGLKAQYFDVDGMHTERAIKGTDARMLFDAGATICCPALEAIHEPFARFAGAARRALGLSGAVNINSYLSAAGGGFALHVDGHSVIIVQLEGEKRWFYSETPTLEAPMLGTLLTPQNERAVRRAYPWFTDAFPSDAQLQQAVLKPGDVLYLPAGTAHRTEAGSYSLALTIACPARRFADLLVEMMMQTLEPVATWRRRLPALGPEATRAHTAMMRQLVGEQLRLARAWLAAVDEEQLVRQWQSECE
jgi:hypothetical protein